MMFVECCGSRDSKKSAPSSEVLEDVDRKEDVQEVKEPAVPEVAPAEEEGEQNPAVEEEAKMNVIDGPAEKINVRRGHFHIH